MDIDLIVRYLNSSWKFILANPEISIFIATTSGTVLFWLLRFCYRRWQRRKQIPPPTADFPSFVLPPPINFSSPVFPPKDEVWFVNVGEHRGHLQWEDCIQYGCIGAGGGAKYRDAIQKLKPEDTVYAYITGEGYVGYGRVIEEAKPVKDFIVSGTSLLKKEIKTEGLEHNSDNLEFSEYVVRMDWLKTYPRDRARWRSDLFIYRGTLCQLTEAETLDFLRSDFQPKAKDKARHYSKLDYYLGKQEWELANKETCQLLLAEFNEEVHQYLELSELMNFPSEPLKIIDDLWMKHSNGKFGFSIQKEIYVACGGIPDGFHHGEAWTRFCGDIGWYGRLPLEYNNAASPTGHLPFVMHGDLDFCLIFPHANTTPYRRSEALGTSTEILFSRLESEEEQNYVS